MRKRNNTVSNTVSFEVVVEVYPCRNGRVLDIHRVVGRRLVRMVDGYTNKAIVKIEGPFNSIDYQMQCIIDYCKYHSAECNIEFAW